MTNQPSTTAVRLTGRVAVVTGAGSGLGVACAQRLGAEGAHVVCLDLTPPDDTVASIAAAGGSAEAVAADVTDLDGLVAVANDVAGRHGRVDVCVANAGIVVSGSALETSPEDWDRVIAVNLTGVWKTARAFLPHLRAQESSSLVVMSSVGGVIGIPDLAGYAAAKGGVIGLMRQLAVDYAPDGVRVNAVAPSTIMTPLVAEHMAATRPPGVSEEDHLAEAASPHPLGRLGRPEDVAAAVAYLAGDDAGWVTGTVLMVDGGRVAS